MHPALKVATAMVAAALALSSCSAAGWTSAGGSPSVTPSPAATASTSPNGSSAPSSTPSPTPSPSVTATPAASSAAATASAEPDAVLLAPTRKSLEALGTKYFAKRGYRCERVGPTKDPDDLHQICRSPQGAFYEWVIFAETSWPSLRFRYDALPNPEDLTYVYLDARTSFRTDDPTLVGTLTDLFDGASLIDIACGPIRSGSEKLCTFQPIVGIHVHPEEGMLGVESATPQHLTTAMATLSFDASIRCQAAVTRFTGSKGDWESQQSCLSADQKAGHGWAFYTNPLDFNQAMTSVVPKGWCFAANANRAVFYSATADEARAFANRFGTDYWDFTCESG